MLFNFRKIDKTTFKHYWYQNSNKSARAKKIRRRQLLFMCQSLKLLLRGGEETHISSNFTAAIYKT